MRVLQNRHRIVYSICTWKIWAIDFIENVAKWKGSYKPCSHPCSSTPTQTHPHSPLPSQEKAILTHTQPKKSHTHQNLTKKRSKNPHPLTSSQEMVTPSLKKSYLPMHNWKKEFHVSNTWYIREIIPFPQHLKNIGLFIFFYWILETASESIICWFVFNN